eukprot:TRINITY_DN164_c0_g1_i13.p1 TRINITY_DN164_c0_g1~~TRINITY_DN164_c0_g1_i13.p1  ORF type:complete len:106 (+),score=4.34 TRINITY_DN164_c0_g1_i13:664-981(+)
MEQQDNVSGPSLRYDKAYLNSLQASLSTHFKLIKEASLDASVFNHKVYLDFSLYLKNSRVGTISKNRLPANFTTFLTFESVFPHSQVYDNTCLHFRSEEQVSDSK